MLWETYKKGFEIWENAFESCCGDGTLNCVASLFWPSLPFTPYDTIVPIRIPTPNVARMVKV